MQCPKLLWRQVHQPETIPAHSEATQAIFKQGHEVGELAQSLYPDGISIPWETPPAEKLALTKSALQQGLPIYEATFSSSGAYAQVDILVPDGDSWNIIEVKSTTSVKGVNLHDLSLQRYACESSGIQVGKTILCHLNNEYVRQGALDIHQLFALADRTVEVQQLLSDVPERLRVLQQGLASPTEPLVAIGPHCSDPYDCVLQSECWSYLPDHSVFDLYRGGTKAWELFQKGVMDLKDSASHADLSDKQCIQVQAVRTGNPQVEAAPIRAFLSSLQYPLWFLDFETFSTAVPLYDGTKPYQQIPFQFSLHVVDAAGATPVHHGWLAEGSADPRPGFLDALQSVLGKPGDIVAYNISFERARLNELGRHFPQHAAWLAETNERFVDLITPFRQFSYYHPDQHGSCSLKAVLPALVGQGYEGMDIAEGSAASREFVRVEHGDVDSDDRNATRRALEVYCAQDTLSLSSIIQEIDRLSKELPIKAKDQ
jgi:hypothetical protein